MCNSPASDGRCHWHCQWVSATCLHDTNRNEPKRTPIFSQIHQCTFRWGVEKDVLSIKLGLETRRYFFPLALSSWASASAWALFDAFIPAYAFFLSSLSSSSVTSVLMGFACVGGGRENLEFFFFFFFFWLFFALARRHISAYLQPTHGMMLARIYSGNLAAAFAGIDSLLFFFVISISRNDDT